MQIQFQNIIPAPLQGSLNAESQVWATEVAFQEGKMHQIYAPSGKGKSTFAHIIYGLRNDFTGTALLDGKATSQISASEWATIRQRKISVVFQDLRLFLHLTALENLQVKAVLYKDFDNSKLTEMAEILGVTHTLNRTAATLSYGERQRIAIIRALIQPFEILILDEPFSHLDEGNIQKASQLIKKRVEEQNAMVLFTSLGYDYHFEYDQKLLLG
jgi:ABC-type lipoprotein export system ATPase subunit